MRADALSRSIFGGQLKGNEQHKLKKNASEFLNLIQEVCELTLISMIDNESVICMLGISDRFNANKLKSNCLSYISQHIELTSSENFGLLSQDLQTEIFDLIQWRKRCPTDSWHNLSSRYDDPVRSRHSLKSPSRPSKSRSRKSSPNNYHK
jgi:hypothetical protein